MEKEKHNGQTVLFFFLWCDFSPNEILTATSNNTHV